MRTLACLRAAGLLDRRAAGLTEAERLVLEEHLASCAQCRAEARVFSAIAGAVAEGEPAPLGPAAREAAVARALARAPAHALARPGSGDPAPGAWTLRRVLPVGALVSAATLAAVATLLWRADLVSLGTPGKGDTPAAAGTARLLSGDLVADGRPLAAGDALAPGTHAVTAGGAVVEAAHARLDLRAGGALTWDSLAATARLEAGAVHVTVDPVPHRPFAVETRRFRVEVLGTEFDVDASGVRVSRGVVRVRAPGGALLAASVAAGEAWSPAIASASAGGSASAASAAPAAPALSPSAYLERARTHLAARDVTLARSDIDAALAARPTRGDEAEARSLLAECALVAGDPVAAADAYAAVAETFTDLPAGETALFAAARLYATAGHTADARTRLRAYLERYPDGRFHKEAATRLRAVGSR